MQLYSYRGRYYQKPVIICPSDTVAAADTACIAWLDDYTGKALVTDNCSQNASVLQLPLPGTPFATDSQLVVLTATDTAGNQSSCSFWVVKVDTTPPSITCPTVTYTVTADAFCNGELADYRPLVAPSVSDNCSPTNLITITQSPDSGTFIGGVGNTQVVTMTVTDTSGNAASCTLNVTVADLTPASFSCPSDTTIYVDTLCDAFLYDIASTVQATDNCGTPSVSQWPIAGLTITGHMTTVGVKLYVNDGNGNIDSSCVVNVTAIDTLPPTFTCPASDTVNVMNNVSCDALVSDFSTLLAADNCALSVNITQAPLAGTIFTGVDTATVYFDDGNGNVDSCEIRLVVRDTVAPAISCPGDTVVYADNICFWTAIPFDTLSSFSTSDNCDDQLEILQAPLAGALLGKGVTPITLVSTDDFNNSRFCVFNVTVKDTTGPEMTCPTDRILPANPVCQAILPDYRSLVTSFDNCDGPRPITQSLPPGINVTGGGGPVAITMTSSDTEGNTSTCTFNVILADNIGPNITGCPNDTTVYLDNNCEYPLADFAALITAIDACGGGVTKNQVPVPGTLYTAGTSFTLTIVAADVANNQNTCTFQVTVADSTKPTIVCNPIQVLLDTSGNYTLDADDIAAITNGSFDNCTDSASLARFVFPSTFSCADVGSPVSVIASISDASINISTCTTTVTVKPTPMTGVANILIPDTAICEGDTLALQATAAQVGQSGLWTLSSTGTFLPNDQDSLASLADLPAGVHELVWTITDQCIASADTITVTVHARPEIVASEITAISTPGGSDGEVEAVTISGNPDSWTWSNGAPSNDTAFNLSAGTYWVIASDSNGCSSDSAFVTLFDPAASGVSVSVRVALQGPYNDNTQRMNDFLRSTNLIPTTDPYGKGATVAASRLAAQANANADIVDWVLVQLYDSVGTGNGGYGSFVAEQAALLRRDGFIVDPVTSLPLEFASATPGGYHVIVKHRNHLAIGTNSVLSLSSSVTVVDFFNGVVPPFSGVAAISTSGKFLMIGGNTNGDGQIDAIDVFNWSVQNGTFNVYNNADMDMNGQVDALDPFGTWVNNNGKFTTLP
ncbi:MAG: HYR domain-containing protein [Bacteroidia bacterium]